MPSYAPRTLAPVKQLQSLAKREKVLNHLIAVRRVGPKLDEAANDVRSAQLLVLKARRALHVYKPDSEAKQLQLQSIAKDEDAWSHMTNEAILELYIRKRTMVHGPRSPHLRR